MTMTTTRLHSFFLAFVLFAAIPLTGLANTAGSLDTSFNPGGNSGTALSLALQPDGKVLYGGNFSGRILRRDTNGTLDTGFAANPAITQDVTAITVQPDGKILVGLNGGLKRLLADGTLDNTFSVAMINQSFNPYVEALLVQADGRILVGGRFVTINGIGRYDFARLNADGSLDASFDPGGQCSSGICRGVKAFAVQHDGKIIISGNFTSIAGQDHKYVARLYSDGTLDTAFKPAGSGLDASAGAMALQPDGKLIISGSFSTISGVSRNRLARLNTDGTLDTSFDTGAGVDNDIYALHRQPDGKLIVAGVFQTVSGIARNGIARLNADGSLDTGFDPGTGFTNWSGSAYPHALAVQPDGKLLAGGYFNQYNSTYYSPLVRLHTGDPDNDGFEDTVDSFPANDAATQDSDADGLPDAWTIANPYGCLVDAANCNGLTLDTLIDVDADSVDDATDNCPITNSSQADTDSDGVGDACDEDIDGDGTPNWQDNCPQDANADQADNDSDGTGNTCDATPDVAPVGSLDQHFVPPSQQSGTYTARSLALLPDGKIIMGGDFSDVNGVTRRKIARLQTDGTLDSGFDAAMPIGGDVYATLRQPDGKVILGGTFTAVNGVSINRVARLHADGTLDTGFNPGVGTLGPIETMALQPDGKIILGGSLDSFNNITRTEIARLNQDGSLDTTFITTGMSSNNRINTLAVQVDGKILVGGTFTTVDGVSRNRIARLNTNGSLDTTFDPGTGANSSVHTLALTVDGRILLGGDFTAVNGVTRNRIARLHNDGSLDTTFDPGTAADKAVLALLPQPDGSVFIGGQFDNVSGSVRYGLARLHADGTLDSDFDIGTPDRVIYTLALQPDGKLLVGGLLYTTGLTNHLLWRVHTGDNDSDGIQDGADAFANNPAAANDADADNLADAWLQPNAFGCAVNDPVCNTLTLDTFVDTDRDTVLSGDNCAAAFNPDQTDNDNDDAGNACDTDNDNDTLLNWMDNCPLHANVDQTDTEGDGIGDACDANPAVAPAGVLDHHFLAGTGANSSIYSLTSQLDGKTVIGGRFTTFNGTDINRLARLNADRSLDTTFNPGGGASGDVLRILKQPDGKFIIAGSFTTYNGVTANHIARIHPDGSLDTTFSSSGAGGTIRAMGLQTDGKIVIGGNFQTVNGATRNRIARLHGDGTLDTTFPSGQGVNNTVYSMAIQPDGKIVIGGDFTIFHLTTRNRIARLHSDGALDTAFTGSVTNGTVNEILVQTDGKVLLGGSFTTVQGSSRRSLARLTAGGSLDTAFNNTALFDSSSTVNALLQQPDGKLLIGGAFTRVGGAFHNGIARLHTDSSLDTTFDPGTGISLLHSIHALAVQDDGKLLAGGNFIAYHQTAISHIIRIHTGNSDGDAVQDGADAFPLDPTETLDTDNDGTGNNTDLDDDNDTVPDYIDAEPLNDGNANEITLPLENNFKGSTVRDTMTVQ